MKLRAHMQNRCTPASRQSGVTIIIALAALLVLLFSGMALIRSFDSSLALAGNLAFKRDLVNQGERGIDKAWAALVDGGDLGAVVTREINQQPFNYSASMLSEASNGVPVVLTQSDSAFSVVGNPNNDIVDENAHIRIRYVIDRLCQTGTVTENDASCIMQFQKSRVKAMDEPSAQNVVGAPLTPVYRVSVRVTGPRGTVTYLQSNLTR